MWSDLEKEVRFSREIRRKLLMKKVIKSFLKFIERKERKQMVLRACEHHIL